MIYITKLIRSTERQIRFLIPEHISFKLSWKKELQFAFYTISESRFVLEPVLKFPFANSVGVIEGCNINLKFVKPISSFKSYSFYLPSCYVDLYPLLKKNYIYLHFQGSQYLILEPFKSNYATRQPISNIITCTA